MTIDFAVNMENQQDSSRRRSIDSRPAQCSVTDGWFLRPETASRSPRLIRGGRRTQDGRAQWATSSKSRVWAKVPLARGGLVRSPVPPPSPRVWLRPRRRTSPLPGREARRHRPASLRCSRSSWSWPSRSSRPGSPLRESRRRIGLSCSR